MNRINLENITKDINFRNTFGVDNDTHFSLLGQGEYNINYIFHSKIHNKNLVIRIATDSQMNLYNQISYEYETLKLLEKTNRTPKALYSDDRKILIPYGFLVMEYLPGKPLDYNKDLNIAAEILGSIHNTTVSENNHLIKPENPLDAIYKESLNMFSLYKSSEYANYEITEKIKHILGKGKNIKNIDIGHRAIINTELNSGNFLINGENKDNYLIDWEKPLYGYPAQDLGHFLAPTTTFWKTDTILSRKEIFSFLKEYCKHSNEYKDEYELWNTVRNYLTMNCLRGITWCAMAYVQYQNPDKLIFNEFTYSKIKSYLSIEFLNFIRDEYLNEY